MPFLSQEQINPTIRKKYLDQYKKQLREALLNPMANEAHILDIKNKLATLGLPKVYDPNSPPPPGAIDISQ